MSIRLAKDLATEYNYLGNSSIYLYNVRTKTQESIDRNSPILIDGERHKPNYDCGGGKIWMITYNVPLFDYDHKKEQYYFK